jgi:Tol biopolymer transport system component
MRATRKTALIAPLLLVLGLIGSTPAQAGGPGLAAQARVAYVGNHHGSRIVWTRDDDPCCDTGHLVSARPDGTAQRVLTHPAAGSMDLDAVISPNGSTIVFERDLPDGSTQIRLIGSDGHGERAIDLGCTDPCAADLEPAWSPNGREILFQRVDSPFDPTTQDAASAVLWAAALDGSGVRRVSEPGIDGVLEDSHPRFSPRGDYLTFVRFRNADHTTAVFRMRPDATHVRRLTPWGLDADLPDLSQARSGPTKDLVVFETFGPDVPAGQSGIGTVPATCRSAADCAGKVRFLSHDPAGVQGSSNPAWSPSGDQIAFTVVSFIASPPAADIWRMRPDGSQPRQVSHAPQFEFRPGWGLASGA